MPAATAKKKPFKLNNQRKRKEPLWKGPEAAGITQSLLSRFLVCRERFRLLVVEGLVPKEGFNHRLEYGTMWHLCEEEFAEHGDCEFSLLKEYVQSLAKKYPTDVEHIEKWYQVCKTQFPIYVNYWKNHKDVKNRTPLLQEQTFSVPYELPSGRVVTLRGMWDSVDLIGKGKRAGIYLQENKTKGDIDEKKITQQLSFDLQTMFYLIALDEARNQPDEAYVADEWQTPIRGVRYNVVRRPLSGGRHSITKHKPTKKNPQGETNQQFYKRLGERIAEDSEFFFMRLQVEVSKSDVEKFKTRCLNPVLEQLCDWWEWVVEGEDPFDHRCRHWQFPYGVYNPLTEGRSSDLDEYINTGSEIGLDRTETLFRELEG